MKKIIKENVEDVTNFKEMVDIKANHYCGIHTKCNDLKFCTESNVIKNPDAKKDFLVCDIFVTFCRIYGILLQTHIPNTKWLILQIQLRDFIVLEENMLTKDLIIQLLTVVEETWQFWHLFWIIGKNLFYKDLVFLSPKT
jgi:hypothetical protein